MDNEIRIALSPVQLAAVMSDETITESETLSNRLWGSLEFVLGVTEMVGATALCVAPEPTGLTKAGCVVVGAHSMDTIKTAAGKVISGMSNRTATMQAVTKLAKQLGADDDTAISIGAAVDVAVPLGVACMVGAARVNYVRTGTLIIAEHEAVKGIKIGGHTLAKHVIKTESELLSRLQQSSRLDFVSSFYTVQHAEKAISSTLKANRLKVLYWANFGSGTRPLELTHRTGNAVGYGFAQGSNIKKTSTAARVVLLKQTYNGKPYYVLTAYPYMG